MESGAVNRIAMYDNSVSLYFPKSLRHGMFLSSMATITSSHGAQIISNNSAAVSSAPAGRESMKFEVKSANLSKDANLAEHVDCHGRHRIQAAACKA